MATTRRAFLTIATVGGALALTSCTAASGAAPSPLALPPSALAIMQGKRYAISRWFVLVADRRSGDPLFELNAGDLVLPASTTKLWTTATALDTFGPDFRFETPVYRRGPDLVLVASGDPTMGGRDTPQGTIAFTGLDHAEANALPGAILTSEDPLAGLDDLAKQVATAGIRRVDGDVLIDARLYDQTPKDDYILTPIMINDNLVDLTITPGAPGTAATVVSRPVTAAYQVRSTVTTTAAGQPAAVKVTTPEPGVISIEGQVPAGDPLLRTQQVADPPSFARTLFVEALGRAGVTVAAPATGPNRADALPAAGSYAAADRVALHRSLPFSENIKLVNKVSMNLHADTLIMLLAAKAGKRTLDEGMQLEQPFIRKAGIDPAMLSLSDGRGNEYTDLFSPRTVGALLRYMTTHPDFATYLASLPVFGVDGTETTVVPADAPVAGKVQAKSGTTVAGDLMNQRALVMTRGNAGYMTSKAGRDLVVAVYVMHTPIGEIEEVLEVAKEVGSVVAALWEAS
ncbi:MAG: D-alanyl-D-alanine carboxypeptidase/D-alanyl-D-alanine-endopeptidase [Pseudonocardia sp.]|uniref:D-alanyl-D-alanine carboxypeptidase/D-alanyl-D-alanine endopeptidase n=1 Tax=Pseudonocardia sp. TaxID=60912 RepID=UPI001AC5DC37|nr:D-alanyl-D-alanine carboxypeptidase/D-alanyl-D-alanine-endopeptidase [Pseudonocardia sp.]MBN9102680.1 D-alanyl-D-alanine carboxypeptidase/D-alanyl-D-alanine-endopeptidase [Pseudonocardia sp.]